MIYGNKHLMTHRHFRKNSLREFVYLNNYHHPGPRRVWMGGSGPLDTGFGSETLATRATAATLACAGDLNF